MGLWRGWGPRTQKWYAENHSSNLDCITCKDQWRFVLHCAFKNILMGAYGTGRARFQDSVDSKLCYPWYTLYISWIELSVTNSIFPSFPALWTNCPGNAHSWPCLHQVRQVSFYFVFHQLLLLNKALGSLGYPPPFECTPFSPGQPQPAHATSCATPCNLLFQQKENLDSFPLAPFFLVF